MIDGLDWDGSSVASYAERLSKAELVEMVVALTVLLAESRKRECRLARVCDAPEGRDA